MIEYIISILFLIPLTIVAIAFYRFIDHTIKQDNELYNSNIKESRHDS